MKLYHVALFFLLVAGGMFVTAGVQLAVKAQNESIRKAEYGGLVAAVNAATEVVFGSETEQISERELEEAETVFFQTMGVLHEGTTDAASWEAWKQRILCLAVFAPEGYYVNYFVLGEAYRWSEKQCYEEERIPECFFRQTEEVLAEYLRRNGIVSSKYRMEPAGKSVWEQSLEQPCVFAIYAPLPTNRITEGKPAFLYAATGRSEIGYYVTEDEVCHYSFCEEVGLKKVVAYYATQKDSAKDGAIPCEKCMK